MLDEIAGSPKPDFPWNDFALDVVLDYYDGPRMILQESRDGQLYLTWWNDTDEDTDRWLYLAMTKTRLREILAGDITVREALDQPETGSLIVVDVDVATDSVLRAVETDAASLPEDSLPLPWVRLNVPFPPEVA